MVTERPETPAPRRRVQFLPGPIALGVLGWMFAAAFSVTATTVGISHWLAYILLTVGLVLLTAATLWGIARARTGERHVRWRGE